MEKYPNFKNSILKTTSHIIIDELKELKMLKENKTFQEKVQATIVTGMLVISTAFAVFDESQRATYLIITGEVAREWLDKSSKEQNKPKGKGSNKPRP